jgi:hypothetical protein
MLVAAAAVMAGDDGPSSAAPGIVGAVTTTPFKYIIPTDRPEATPTLQFPLSTSASVTPASTAPTVTPTIDDAWNATPDISTPEPTAVSGTVAALIASIESEYGARAETGAQDWGDDDAAQLRNLGAVREALASLPPGLIAAVNANPGGPLSFLSNNDGRTEGGWQPYGDRAANFYSNEDVVGGRKTAANQVVLQPGSTAQTIAHEIMHAYQLREQAPGDYAGALLTPEMKSFMQATGWTQLVPDDTLREGGDSWETLNAGFRYDGRPLSYPNERGETSTLFAPNPLEAYAEAGGLYYARSNVTTLPDWPEYWDWFAANIG